MKACFPIVGEKEYKDSISITKQRQWVFTKPRIGSIFISFVSFSFNKPHVSVPTRTCIRAIRVRFKYRARSACKIIRSIRLIRVQNNLVFKPPVSAPPRTRSVRSVRSVCKRIFVTFALFVFKTSRESIEIHHWSIPHCGQPQQFNIQHSKLNIALRASVCKKIFVTFA